MKEGSAFWSVRCPFVNEAGCFAKPEISFSPSGTLGYTKETDPRGTLWCTSAIRDEESWNLKKIVRHSRLVNWQCGVPLCFLTVMVSLRSMKLNMSMLVILAL